jgi:CBS domain-containing protein
MLRLHDIMTRDVVTLDPDMTLRDALDILSARRISGAPVLEAGRIVGVLSAMDIIEFLAITPGVPDVGDDEDSRGLDDGADTPSAYFVDFWPPAGADVADRFSDTHAAAWDLLTEHTVADAMSGTVVAFPPTAETREAADAMQREHAHRVLVTEGNRLVGIVSALDIARAVAERMLESPRYAYGARL